MSARVHGLSVHWQAYNGHIIGTAAMESVDCIWVAPDRDGAASERRVCKYWRFKQDFLLRRRSNGMLDEREVAALAEETEKPPHSFSQYL